MHQVETEFLEWQAYKLLVWFPYVENVFFLWTHGQEKVWLFLEDLNKCHTNIKFTHETNKGGLLDIKLSTDLFVKSLDLHQFLHYTSWHPGYTKYSIVFSQALRNSRIYSYESNFFRHLANMKSWSLEKDILQIWLTANQKTEGQRWVY